MRKIPQFVLNPENRQQSASIVQARRGVERASQQLSRRKQQFNKFGKAQFEGNRKTTLSAVGVKLERAKVESLASRQLNLDGLVIESEALAALGNVSTTISRLQLAAKVFSGLPMRVPAPVRSSIQPFVDKQIQDLKKTEQRIAGTTPQAAAAAISNSLSTLSRSPERVA